MPEEEKNNSGAGAQQTAPAVKKSKAPIFIIGGIVLLLVILGVGFFFFKDLIMPVRGVNGAVLSSKCKYNDKDLCRFLNNFSGLDDMSAKSTTTVEGKKSESIIELQGADKSHFVTTVGGKEESNYISIGNTSYMKDLTDNKWWKTTTAETKTEESTKSDWKKEFEKDLKDTSDKTTYKKIGKEACGKLICLKYQVIDPQVTDSTQYIWFDTKEYLMRKTTDEAKGVVTETTFTYGKLNITEPSPVKDMKSPDNITQDLLNDSTQTGAALQGLSEEEIRQLQEMAEGAANEIQLETE